LGPHRAFRPIPTIILLSPRKNPLVPSLSHILAAIYELSKRLQDRQRDGARNGDLRQHHELRPRHDLSSFPAFRTSQPSNQPTIFPSLSTTFLSSAISNAFSVLFVSFCVATAVSLPWLLFFHNFLLVLFVFAPNNVLAAGSILYGLPICRPLSFIHSCTQLRLHFTRLHYLPPTPELNLPGC